jgi:hypothetical protein
VHPDGTAAKQGGIKGACASPLARRHPDLPPITGSAAVISVADRYLRGGSYDKPRRPESEEM